MTYSTIWIRLCESEEEYRVRQYDFKQDQEAMLIDLKKVLVEDNITALRFLAALEPGIAVVAPLLSTVLDLAIDSSSPDRIVLARAVLVPCKEDPWIKSTIQALIENYLPLHDEWHYRRIAELYIALSYQKELAAFLVLCQASENVEIKRRFLPSLKKLSKNSRQYLLSTNKQSRD